MVAQLDIYLGFNIFGIRKFWDVCSDSRGVTSVAFSPDGTQVVSGSYGRIIYVWDAKTLQQIIHPPISHSSVQSTFYQQGYLSPGNKLQKIIGSLVLRKHLFWIPPHLFDSFPQHFILDIISSQSLDKFYESHFVHGEEWTKCHADSLEL